MKKVLISLALLVSFTSSANQELSQKRYNLHDTMAIGIHCMSIAERHNDSKNAMFYEDMIKDSYKQLAESGGVSARASNNLIKHYSLEMDVTYDYCKTRLGDYE